MRWFPGEWSACKARLTESDFERARLISKACRSNPVREFPFDLGQTYCRIGRASGIESTIGRSFLDKGVEYLRRSIEISSAFYPAIEALAVALDELGRLDEAEVIHQMALQTAPRHRRVHVNYALHLHAIADRTGSAVDRVRAKEYYEFVYSNHRGSGDVRLVNGWKLFTSAK